MTPRVRILPPAQPARRLVLRTAMLLVLGAGSLAAPRAAGAVCPAVLGTFASDGTNCNGIRITWDRETEGTGWRVHRGIDPGGSDRTLLATVGGASYTDTTAVPGVVYSYWVQQYGGICGSFSPLGTPDSGYHGKPVAPTGLATSSQFCGKVRLTWNAVAGAASYDVLRSLTSSVQEATLVGDTTGTTYDDGAVELGAFYYYWVRARSTVGCIGVLPVTVAVGHAGTPPLPDLTLDPDDTNIASVEYTPNGRRLIRFATSVRNGGTAPLVLFPSWTYWDDTNDVRQRVLHCQGQIVDRYLGRFPRLVDDLYVPHFVRARLRQRELPSGDPGDVVAQTDLPAICLTDVFAWSPGLPGAPATKQFTSCASGQQGISIGWMNYESSGVDGHFLDLACITPGYYWFELIVDPDGMIQEGNESNNVVRRLLNFTTLPPPPDYSVCSGPQVVGQLLSPDSLQVAVGAPTDSIVGRVWIAGLTEPAGAHELTVAQIGYREIGTQGFGEIPFTWTPAQWRRQDGADDVYGGSISVPNPGNYEYAFRFSVFDGPWIYADFTGSLDGFSSLQTGRLRVLATTDAGEPPAVRRLAFEALSDPASGATRFRVSLPSASNLVVSIYDVLGRRVRTLERGARPEGVHLLDWDGRDEAGRAVASGIFVARLDADGQRLARKFLRAR